MRGALGGARYRTELADDCLRYPVGDCSGCCRAARFAGDCCVPGYWQKVSFAAPVVDRVAVSGLGRIAGGVRWGALRLHWLGGDGGRLRGDRFVVNRVSASVSGRIAGRIRLGRCGAGVLGGVFGARGHWATVLWIERLSLCLLRISVGSRWGSGGFLVAERCEGGPAGST